MADAAPVEEKQCRICLDSEVEELGRLIRPCLCKGSISFVHVKCLQQWRNSSPSSSAFFSCPQCHYRYHFARTRVYGIATNPVIIGALSSLLFTALVFLSSFITTYFMNAFEEGSSSGTYYYSPYWTSPYDVGQDLVRAALRILQEESGIIDPSLLSKTPKPSTSQRPPMGPLNAPDAAKSAPPGYLKSFFQRILLGLPIVGAGSLVHMLLSFPLLGPVHWLARYRGNRGRRRENTRDVAAMVIIVLLVVGAARALWKVYEFTQKFTKRLLLRAEDAILEVN